MMKIITIYVINAVMDFIYLIIIVENAIIQLKSVMENVKFVLTMKQIIIQGHVGVIHIIHKVEIQFVLFAQKIALIVNIIILLIKQNA